MPDARLAITAGGCAATRAYRQGNDAMRLGQSDQAVAYFRVAVQNDPDNPSYRSHSSARWSPRRASTSIARRNSKQRGSSTPPAANSASPLEYRSEQPDRRRQGDEPRATNPGAQRGSPAAIADRSAESTGARRRAASGLNPVTDVVDLRFATNTNLRDILSFLADQSGISIVYDRDTLTAMANSGDQRGPAWRNRRGSVARQLLTLQRLHCTRC